MSTRQPEVPEGQGEMQRALRGGQEACALTHMEVGFYTETNLGKITMSIGFLKLILKIVVLSPMEKMAF